jgi:hypothetical protein
MCQFDDGFFSPDIAAIWSTKKKSFVLTADLLSHIDIFFFQKLKHIFINYYFLSRNVFSCMFRPMEAIFRQNTDMGEHIFLYKISFWMCLNIMKLKLANHYNVVNTRNTKVIPGVPTFSNSSTYINSTASKFVPAGEKKKKKKKKNVETYFVLGIKLDNKGSPVILYYIVCCTDTCLNIFSVHFEAHFCSFSCVWQEKLDWIELNLGLFRFT